jgi:hypothetical protein
MQMQSRRPRALPRLIVVLASLLALGQFQGASHQVATSHELVAGPVSTTAMATARLVRHLPNPAPSSQPNLVLWAGAALLLLLPGLGVAAWSPSRRTRQAYLLPFAGRGPPVFS